jgi:hypothetical protein
MSAPSISDRPPCGSNVRCRSASAVDLPAPVGPTSAIVSPGAAVNVSRRPPAALVVGESDVAELDPARAPAGIDRAGPVVHRRHGVENVEELLQARRIHEHAVDECSVL